MSMKRIMPSFLIILLGFLMLTLVSSCDTDTDGDGVEDKIDKEPNTPAKYISSIDENGKACIKSVYMLLDNTGSMNGYKNGGSEFLDAISTLAGSLNSCKTNQEVQNVIFQNYGSDAPSSELNFKDFSSLLISPASKAGSNIVDHFDKLTNMVSDSTIGIYVTDAIISLNDGKSAEMAAICKSQLIPSCARVLGKSENGAIILRCKSKFNGSYQSSASPKKYLDLNDPARPYFIFIFGKRSSLDFLIDKTIKNNTALTDNVTDISFINYEPLAKIEASIDMNIPKGSWVLEDNTINSFGNSDIEVPIGIDLSFITNLKSNLALDSKDIAIENGEILGIDTKINFFANSPGVDKSAYPNATHIIKVKYTNDQMGQSSKIYLKTNDWSKECSTSDDSSVEAIRPKIGGRKTFELDKIIGSIFQASEISKTNRNLHIATINFSKQ